MPIAGVVVITDKKKTNDALNMLEEMENVSTYGVHKENHIIVVLEGKDEEDLEAMTARISADIPGILGVYPTYVTFEDESEE